MRALADADRIRRFMDELAHAARAEGRVYPALDPRTFRRAMETAFGSGR